MLVPLYRVNHRLPALQQGVLYQCTVQGTGEGQTLAQAEQVGPNAER